MTFASKGLWISKRNMSNYSSRKLELLALKWVVTETFEHYLAVGKFVVLNYHKSLAHFQTATLGAVRSRWLGDLKNFTFQVKQSPVK